MVTDNKIQAAQAILRDLGLPPAQQNKMSALVLLALAGLSPETPWSDAKRISRTVTRGIMDFIKDEYDVPYAPNTRETVRRQVLHQFVQAGVAEYNPDNPSLPVNSPKAHYALTKEVLAVMRTYSTEQYGLAIEKFLKTQPALVELYSKKRDGQLVPVTLPDGRRVELSPGHHSLLQAKVIEDWAGRFAPGAKLLYLGDTAQKTFLLAEDELHRLSIPVDEHEKLPDVLLLSEDGKSVFIVEVVTSHGPVSPKRFEELEAVLAGCPLRRVYVTAFPDIAEFRKHIGDIAWETEVWIAAVPDHMIHFNGPKFLQ